MTLFFYQTMGALGIKESVIARKELPLVRFNSSITYAIRTMVLPIMLGGFIVMTNFVVIDVPRYYNAILSTLWIHKIKAVPSTFN